MALVTAESAFSAERPLSVKGKITTKDLEGRSLRELTLMRNTIYARAGNTFRKKWLRDHFTQQPWYRPTGLDLDRVGERDRNNADAIARFENALPRLELEKRRTALLASHKAAPDRSAVGAEAWPANDLIELMLLSRALGIAVDRKIDPEPSPLDDPSMLDKLITVEQLADLSPRDLKITRNMIFARRGRVFKTPILREYFARMAWYVPDAKYTDDKLSELDWKNVRIVESVEAQIGTTDRKNELRERDEWMGGA